MIIHQPELIIRDGQAFLWSRLELEHPQENFPDYLWYRVPEVYASGLSTQSDPFLLPALLAGICFGENIQVRGVVSPRLAYHLEEYQYLIHFRINGAPSPVEIKYNRLAPLQVSPMGVGSTFSGGVDSLFTLWVHHSDRQSNPDFQITHAIFIMGFDILQSKAFKYQHLLSRYWRALKDIDVNLIPVETNAVRMIVPRLFLNYYCGPVLAGCGHLFGGMLKRFFIPSSRDYTMARYRISSTDSLSDALLSSDSLDIIHHGAVNLRTEKIERISDWELAHEHLRVCTHGKHEDNCSTCEKCVRTMIPLYCLGKLENFKTFHRPLKANWEALRWARKLDPGRHYSHETISFALIHKKRMAGWIRVAIILGYLRHWVISFIPSFLKSWLKKYGFFVDPMLIEDAYENSEVLYWIKSQ